MAIHQALEGNGPATRAMVVAAFCRQFHSTPLVAERELEHAPAGFIEEVIQADRYMEAYSLVKQTKDETTLPESPWIRRVHENEASIVLAKIRAQQQAENPDE